MICQPCRLGGRATLIAKHADLAYIEELRRDAADWHANCKAPTTCPCQHLTGQMTTVEWPGDKPMAPIG